MPSFNPEEDAADFHWPSPAELANAAERVVDAVRRGFPADIREASASVPVTLVPEPDEEMLADGLTPDILGLFVGNDHGSGMDGTAPLPGQILLFLDNLWDYSDGDWDTFREEVRTTYLHELGHYLGWDEDEIEARGLG